ncbi:MAG TPA: L-threonylcarbamoyladenylate synthase [Thermoanaerobaculia bacterium]|nr:L-threonylcarbamoyladenylate synthase [Thermoanaerobaculia bacterium]
MVERIRLTGSGPDDDQIERIAAPLRRGSVIVLPTDTIYGFHALAGSDEAIRRIFAIKGREERKALPVLFANMAQLRDAGVRLPLAAAEFLEQTWPAPLTAILPLERPLAAASGAATVAARVPDLPWLRELLQRTGPLASTSANRSGEAPVTDPIELDPTLLNEVALVVDSGRLQGEPSTVVDFTEDLPRVVREGSFRFTQKLWKRVWKSL